VRGFSLYVLGHAEPPGQLRVFKLERMIEATLTSETFKPINTEELLERVDKSWVVWMTDKAAVPVRLHFAPSVARAVCEARWHASQTLEELRDGSVEMRLAVASTVELVPWILGWGKSCEVLEPEELRRQVAAEHAAAAKRYKARRRRAGLPVDTARQFDAMRFFSSRQIPGRQRANWPVKDEIAAFARGRLR
jgi:predicted DNA-binding transcriptional regulator YafY